MSDKLTNAFFGMNAPWYGLMTDNAGYNTYADPGSFISENEAQRANRKAKEQAQRDALGAYGQMEALLDETYANRPQYSTAEDVDTLRSLLNYNPEDFAADISPFEYNKSREDFINYNRDKILADVGKAAQGTAAGAGLGLSRGTGTNIINAQMDKSEQLWNDAWNQYNQDREFERSSYDKDIANNQMRLDRLLGATKDKATGIGGLLGNDEEWTKDYLSSKMNLIGDKAKTNTDYAMANMQDEGSLLTKGAPILGSVLSFL